MRIFHPCKKCIVQLMCKNKCDKLENFMKFTNNVRFFDICFIVLAIIYWIVFISISIVIDWFWILIPGILAIVFSILIIQKRISLEPSWDYILIGSCILPAIITYGMESIIEWYYYKDLPKEISKLKE